MLTKVKKWWANYRAKWPKNPRTVKYTRMQKGHSMSWGENDWSRDGLSFQASGFGPLVGRRMSYGDFVVFTAANYSEVRYRILKIDYERDPADMFRITLKKWPEDAS